MIMKKLIILSLVLAGIIGCSTTPETFTYESNCKSDKMVLVRNMKVQNIVFSDMLIGDETNKVNCTFEVWRYEEVGSTNIWVATKVIEKKPFWRKSEYDKAIFIGNSDVRRWKKGKKFTSAVYKQLKEYQKNNAEEYDVLGIWIRSKRTYDRYFDKREYKLYK